MCKKKKNKQLGTIGQIGTSNGRYTVYLLIGNYVFKKLYNKLISCTI